MEVGKDRPKILIVDDIPENLVALKMLLKKIDVDVVKANSGKEALEATLHQDFNLILLDVMMPEMDGYQVAEVLHNNEKTVHIPIIFITAMDKNDAHESLGYSKGAVDFLFKPVNETILLSKIKVHLELQKRRQFIRHSLAEFSTEKPKILIVDDNPENLLALEKILLRQDVEVIKATSGNEALSATLYNDFALIILDVRMPGMDGFEVAEILKFDERTDTIPIIFITILDSDDEKELQGYQKGAVDYIIKPFNAFILQSKVKVFLELYRIKTALENLVRERNRDLEEANLHLLQHNQRLKGIVETISKLTSHDNIASIGSLVLEEFAKHMETRGGSLYFVESHGLRLMHSIDPDHAVDFLKFPLPENSIFNRVMESGLPIVSEDIQSIGNIEPSGWKGYTSNSILIFPLLENSEKIIAIIALHNKKRPPFTNHDLEIGNILSSFVSENLRSTMFQEALLKSQRQYTALFEKANDGFFILDSKSYRIVDANHAALDICGYDIDSLQNKSFSELAVNEFSSLPETISGFEKAEDLGQINIKRADGNIRTVNLSLVPLDSSNSICIAKDVTAKLKIEMQLQQAQKMESLGTLAGGIAHDFNNLLSPILGHTDLLLITCDKKDKIYNNLNEINTAAKRAKELVKQILTFSHQEKADYKPIHVEPVVEEAIKLLRATLPSTIEIEKNIGECGMVNADATHLHQVVMNLSTNAYHAMKGTGGVLSISVENSNFVKQGSLYPNVSGESFVLLTVKDTGPGMDKELLEKIFDPFFTTKLKEEGTGMGLSVVHGIVTNLGGEIYVDSKLNKGSIFSIYLPLSPERQNSGRGVDQEELNLTKGNESILIVDDNSLTLNVTRLMLEYEGYDVTSFNDSQLALEGFSKAPNKYQLVLTDLTMPHMCGDTLAGEIIKIAPKIPVIILTGYSGEVKNKTNHPNILYILDKPIDQSELSQMVRKTLDKWK